MTDPILHAFTVDEILIELRQHLPYSLNVEIYTDVDEGWDVYVNGDLPGRREDRSRTFHEFTSNETLRDILAARLVDVRAAASTWDPINGYEVRQMRFSRDISPSEQLDDPEFARKVLEELCNEVTRTIAREHMDHDITAHAKTNEDGSVTLAVEY